MVKAENLNGEGSLFGDFEPSTPSNFSNGAKFAPNSGGIPEDASFPQSSRRQQ
jgi:hypothetical protein